MQKVLLCLDHDPQPSAFDAVVAIDAGVDRLLRHGGVEPLEVEPLVHGAMFTRAPEELQNTAIFLGGSDVAAAEELMRATANCFFGPMRVSVLLDPSGANTTAAAAVIAARRHGEFSANTAAAVVGTGPVGQRVAWMLASEGLSVRICSRSVQRAKEVCDQLAPRVPGSRFSPIGTTETPLAEAMSGSQVLVAAGPAGVQVAAESVLEATDTLRVAVDLNAVPPAGLGGIEVTDKAVKRGSQVHYGAIGVGGLKMKIHKAALRRLFESNDALLDATEIYAIGKSLEPQEA